MRASGPRQFKWLVYLEIKSQKASNLAAIQYPAKYVCRKEVEYERYLESTFSLVTCLTFNLEVNRCWQSSIGYFAFKNIQL